MCLVSSTTEKKREGQRGVVVERVTARAGEEAERERLLNTRETELERELERD